MSRIGKKPIVLADKVSVKIDHNKVSVKGPKGELTQEVPNNISLKQEGTNIIVKPFVEDDDSSSLWGLTRTIVSNMVVGVSSGFIKQLEFNGVGYKAQVSGRKLVLNLGFSHPIEYQLPTGIDAKVVTNKIEISGCNKELVGFVAAQIRSFRPPEPYKGKGIKYLDEKIIKKAGKTGAKK